MPIKKILVVDDSPTERHVLVELLTKNGYKVITAENGEEGIEKAKAECYRIETHCRKCGREVDKSLPYKDPQTGRVNRWAKSFGHATELDAGGHPYRGHLEHVHCNSSAGATYGNKKRAKQKAHASQPLTYSPHSDGHAS